jgi:hypothetical protein
MANVKWTFVLVGVSSKIRKDELTKAIKTALVQPDSKRSSAQKHIHEMSRGDNKDKAEELTLVLSFDSSFDSLKFDTQMDYIAETERLLLNATVKDEEEDKPICTEIRSSKKAD